MKTIIAICSTTGPGSGKSTYMNEVVRKTLSSLTHLRFSDPLVDFLVDSLHDLHGESRDSYETLKATELLPGRTGRDIMIAMGEGIRQAWPSFFADVLIQRLGKVEADSVVIDDVRKVPEILALVNSGHDILFVNVMKPHVCTRACAQTSDPCDIEADNDTEFDSAWLKHRVEMVNEPFRVRLMTVTWDADARFRRVDSHA